MEIHYQHNPDMSEYCDVPRRPCKDRSAPVRHLAMEVEFRALEMLVKTM